MPAASRLEEIAEQHREADRLNKRYGKSFRILKGIEADILADGSLDYPDSVLDSFDFVVASVHSRFKMPKKEQTDRILKAIRNPHTTILGHMTGRQLQRRPGYEIDIEKILKACAEYGVAVEINAHPVAARSRLALAPKGARLRLHASASIQMPTRSASSTTCIGASRWRVRAAFRRTAYSTRCRLQSSSAISPKSAALLVMRLNAFQLLSL